MGRSRRLSVTPTTSFSEQHGCLAKGLPFSFSATPGGGATPQHGPLRRPTTAGL